MDSSIVKEAFGPLEGPFASINGVVLTPDSAQLVVEVVNSMTAGSLKANRNVLGMHKQEPSAVRDHLLRAVNIPEPLPKTLVEVLKKRIRVFDALELYSEDFIAKSAMIWGALFGQHAVGLALALSERGTLHPIANRLLNARPESFPKNQQACVNLMLETLGAAFNGCISTIGGVFDSNPLTWVFADKDQELASQVPPKGREEEKIVREQMAIVSTLEARVAELTDQLMTAKEDAGQRLAAVETEWRKKLDAERERANRVSGLEAQVRAAKESETELRVHIAERQRLFEDEVKQRVESELSSVVRPWLEEARSLEGLSAARTDKSLAERAAALLHDQEALDMKYGSRTRLRRRLKDFEDYASKIRSALEDSIKPSQGLAPLLVDIESEIHRTRVILGEDRPQSQLVIKLEEALNKASTSDALDSLADNIAALHSASVFTHKEHVRLTKQTFKAYDRLRTREELRPAPAQRRSGRELCLVLGNNRKATVYLDGNNVVHRDDRYAHLFDESGKVSKEVEEAFLRDVGAIASKCPAVTIRVVFDSHKASEQSISDNVIVQRSGGSGTDRADSAIVLHLLAEKRDGDSSFVMTDDNDLRQQTTKLGGVYADVAVWAVLIEAFGVELLPVSKVVPDPGKGS